MWFKHRNTTLGIPFSFMETQKITFEELCEIVKLHKERYDLHCLLTSTKDEVFMVILFNQLTQIEYELQMLWGFETNRIWHRSWEWSHCSCPKMDNRDAFPYRQYATVGCPLHDQFVFKTIEDIINNKTT